MPDSRESASAWWSSGLDETLRALEARPEGLTAAEAALRLQRHGPNALRGQRTLTVLALLLRQLTSPIVLILIAAAVLSFTLSDATDGLIILAIIALSSLLGFGQEYRATRAVARLQQMVELKATVLRDGREQSIAATEVVPGDVVLLSAGSSVPADCRLLEERNLYTNEATLTGETFPVEKSVGELPADTPVARRSNCVFQGTHAVSGTARALVLRTGEATEFGAIAQRLRLRPDETEFERGVRSFGNLLIRVTLLLVMLIFAFNVALHRPVLEAFLFALALAVGLTPELLPAIISVNLASGARRMAAQRVIVKRLAAIENFGSMDVLCSDKTGTLTVGQVELAGALDSSGQASARVLQLAGLNAGLQTGFRNPIDAAIVAAAPAQAEAQRLDELPYDFTRKRLSVLVRTGPDETLLVTKGALAQVLQACSTVEGPDGSRVPLAGQQAALQALHAGYSARGLRTLGLAYKALPQRQTVSEDDESELVFLGFLVLADPPKPGIADTLRHLHGLGVHLKIITGDNPLVAAEVARQIGFKSPRVMSGQELHDVGDDALPELARHVDVFAEVVPNQKERIIRALRTAGHVVGYLGDGINDAPALHAADVGISVQGAADVAKDAADIVLLSHSLDVLITGIREGRKTFANTLKYVFMATSANFGNMFSMAGASLLLPFLPLLPKQILLTNLLTDLPEMAIATDHVDANALERPRHWDVRFIRNFMLYFGLLSSVFDFLTFGLLYWMLQAAPAHFRSGWFVESVVSAALVVLIIRTRRPFWHSRPSLTLSAATAAVIAATVALPYTPLGPLFGFAPLPAQFLGLMALLVLLYVACAEGLKHLFYRRHHLQARRPAHAMKA